MGHKCKKDKCEHKPYDTYDDLLYCCNKDQPIFFVNVKEYQAIKHHDGYGKIKGKMHESNRPCCRFGNCKKKDCDKCCRRFKGRACNC